MFLREHISRAKIPSASMFTCRNSIVQAEIVGVVGHVKWGPGGDAKSAVKAQFFYPFITRYFTLWLLCRIRHQKQQLLITSFGLSCSADICRPDQEHRSGLVHMQLPASGCQAPRLRVYAENHHVV